MNNKKFHHIGYILWLFVVLTLAVALSFFHVEIANTLDVPNLALPAVSLVIVIAVLVSVWRHEKRAELIKYEFITIATHKFRTPLTRFKWGIDMLKRDDISRDEKLSILRQMDTGNERLIETIDILIGVAKIDNRSTYTLEAVAFHEMIEGVLEKYSHISNEKSIAIEVHQDKNVPMITIDTKKIRFVVEVLIQNALSYTPNKGKISIRVMREKESIILEVQDSGIGMTRRDIKQAFQAFDRGDDARSIDTEGMGLGLYISRVIVKRHKGKIWAESAGRNKGSQFYVELPLK